ncbi:DUF4270 family protein [Ekhidna sp.]
MILIPVFLSCETNQDLGINYELESNTNVKFVEFTLPATNIFLDSLRTDGENRILVGTFNDPLTGSVNAEGYFQFLYEGGPFPRKRQTSGEPNPPDTLQLDSIIVTFESNAVIPQSGSSFQEFKLVELQDSLESSAVYLSNLQQIPATEIGTYSSTINTLLDTLYRIKLEDDYANSFFDLIGDITADSTQLVITTIFQSLGVIPGASSESIAALDLASDTSRLIMYSSPADPDAEDTTYLTTFRFTGKNYSYLDRDRTGSSFDGIVENANFDLASNQTLIDPLSGISTAFSITPLEDFFRENGNILINNATLAFEFESENDRDTLVSFINFLRKEDNSIFGPATVTNSFANIVMNDAGYLNLQTAPAIGTLNDSKENILISSTLFYQQLYNQFNKADSLAFLIPTSGEIRSINDLVTISAIDVTLNRTILAEDGIKLRLYYTEVN